MAIQLSTETIEVRITPERGADITQLIHRPSGINVFAQSPTGKVTNSRAGWSDSKAQWLNGYPGGWQLLVPNASTEREWDGVVQGFHGEASLATWTVLSETVDHCELETYLLTAPLHLHRNIAVSQSRLMVTDRITNMSPEPTTFRLCQHPAFGQDFLGEGSYLLTTAGRFIADAENTGSLAEPNATGAPTDVLSPGPVPHSVSLPNPGSGDSLAGVLTEFQPASDADPGATAIFVSPSTHLVARLSWDPQVYPFAWVWFEANTKSTWPWFGRLYSLAIEPANMMPGSGPAPGGPARGGLGTTLDPAQTLTSEVGITLSTMP